MRSLGELQLAKHDSKTPSFLFLQLNTQTNQFRSSTTTSSVSILQFISRPLIPSFHITSHLVLVNMSAPPNTKATTTDKDVESKETKPAAALEEDDEFEDFPVEGEFAPEGGYRYYMEGLVLMSFSLQTGHKKRLRFQEITRTYGRRAGMMMIPVKTFRRN